MLRHTASIACSAAFALASVDLAQAGIMTFTAAGDAPSVTASVDAFRAALGALNPNGPGSLGGGRREINWDAVPDGLSSPNVFPGDFFNFTTGARARGARFTTTGDHFEVSAKLGNPTATAVEFGNIEPNYVEEFATFSPQRLFAAVSSVETVAEFFVPGTVTVQAGVTGFGAVFTDVDLAGPTTIVCYDKDGNELGSAVAPAAPGSGLMSFAGVLSTGPERIAWVEIVTGNLPLGPGNLDGPEQDVVAMDDFIYGEPISLDCPTDLNGDGKTDSADLGMLLAAWGPVVTHPADYNGDQYVWSDDLGILIAAWGPCAE